MKRSVYAINVLLVLFSSITPIAAEPAHNVIIMVADGMGYAHSEAASLYRFGAPEKQCYWDFMHLGMSTFSLNNEQNYDVDTAWRDFEQFSYKPTDSAAAATALSTGVKGYNGRIAEDEAGERPVHLAMQAETLGKATGVLSTVRFAHATPAAFAVHHPDRNDELAISRKMILDSPLEVIIGAGHPWYSNDGERVGGLYPGSFHTPLSYDYVGGLRTWRKLLKEQVGADADADGIPDPWTLYHRPEDFRAGLDREAPKRLLGVAPVDSTLQERRGGEAGAPAFAVAQNTETPDMSLLVKLALRVLAQDHDGFFLMAEGGAIDWASHANLSGRMIEEQIDFDKAVECVMEWVEENSSWEETMLFVTADHECGYVSGPGSNPEWTPLEGSGLRKMPRLEWHSGQHTNQLVPLFAKGAGVERLREHIRGQDARRGPFVDNTDIARVIRAAWGY